MGNVIGSGQLEEALRLLSSRDAVEAARGLEIAAGIEMESIAFYSKQAGAFSGSEMQHFFRFLVGQEEGHLQAILILRESLEKKGTWVKPVVNAVSPPKMFLKEDWDKGVSGGLTAILFALWKEKQAQEFYQRLSESVPDKGAKNFFKALSEFEKGHAAMLAEYAENSYYTRELIMG